MVIEIVCVGGVSQKDAKSTCRGYHNRIPIPKMGDHVIATGPFILDTQTPGHGWNEIHPVFALTIDATKRKH